MPFYGKTCLHIFNGIVIIGLILVNVMNYNVCFCAKSIFWFCPITCISKVKCYKIN